ncbi:MAG TPA: cupin domain-containing protein [bacterium]|nr:cupin domain-containing protein [bacterium]
MRKMLVFILVFLCSMTGYITNGGAAMNVLKEAPYQDKGMGKKKLVDEKYLLMMQAALKPGQEVPQHTANSNVHIVVIKGKVVINLAGEKITAEEGDLIPVAFGTPMNIKNLSDENATFLILKTPNPSEMTGAE